MLVMRNNIEKVSVMRASLCPPFVAPSFFFPFDGNLGKKQLEKLLGATGRIVTAPAHCLSDGECGMTISVSISKAGCQAKALSFVLAKRLPNNTYI